MGNPILSQIERRSVTFAYGNNRVTVNPVLNVDQYPLPNIDIFFTNLFGSKKISKVDLTKAYHQMELVEASKQLFNAHKGLYMYNRNTK